jgi:hypothetical protein
MDSDALAEGDSRSLAHQRRYGAFMCLSACVNLPAGKA